MIPVGLLSLSLAVVPSSAALLYVSSYAGTITTLSLTIPSGNASSATLEAISTSDGCAPSPAWLTLDYPNSRLYCTDEGLTTPNGTVSSFQTSDDGSLVQLDKIDVISGPVSAVIYGEGGDGLALAQYGGSSFTTLSIADAAALTVLQSETYKLSQPGSNPSRQEASHPHEALLDPTGDYILVPDLGADLVRIFKVEEGGLEWTSVDPLVTVPGTGPRHAAFLATDEKTFMYLVGELANTITGYEVVYNSNSTLSFVELFAINTHGEGETVPKGTTAAEIELSPDEKFLVVSSRGENSFTIPNFDPTNSTEIISDAIISFSLDHATGGLTHVQTAPSGGRIPRQFSINKAGDMVAIGLQSDGRVVVVKRDVQTGLLGNFLASADIAGEVTAVIFDE
ncbi:Lactonase, 7-bladed beta-propeller-domain-containing protein [Pseudomassariella vexata]|uniref:Lactonase, 7-bladed beta-propeller-domain-containing protein n=1 Tax=Pseudomassariella vexata TaxID=1141098 RepID=A0A1Y2E0H4_9PEZI|nr:Lactonase, 7-bladed beta-propeller-domain-containing protein [Pseudomassariella vexata]ORY64979.1 Lactonase, 7-bladed beta-propeller-domain-containing protein [Pseudomassariella vexata]